MDVDVKGATQTVGPGPTRDPRHSQRRSLLGRYLIDVGNELRLVVICAGLE